jgi:inosose dehydratase
MTPSRRRFLKSAAAAAATAPLVAARSGDPGHVATNQYPWLTFYQRDGRDLPGELDAALGEVAAAGLQGWEPLVESPGDVDLLAPLLAKHGLEVRSAYVNSVLHDEAKAEASIASVLEVARKLQPLGTRIVVTNPTPMAWGGAADKSDAQLRFQAGTLDALGARLRGMGIALAYHNHDAELRQGAREFHHMLSATDAENVKFCLDAHWIFRGCGGSQVALFDVARRYAPRIVELHLRQSAGGPWTEAFALEGDIDYARLFATLGELGVRPHYVLEQAVETGSPKTLSALAAHRRGVEALRSIELPA